MQPRREQKLKDDRWPFDASNELIEGSDSRYFAGELLRTIDDASARITNALGDVETAIEGLHKAINNLGPA